MYRLGSGARADIGANFGAGADTGARSGAGANSGVLTAFSSSSFFVGWLAGRLVSAAGWFRLRAGYRRIPSLQLSPVVSGRTTGQW